jgi:hypothetical protein
MRRSVEGIAGEALEVAADRSLTAIDVQEVHDNAITRRVNGSDFMDSHDVLAITEALLVPAATAALGAAGILIRDWRVRRDVENRRVRVLADAGASLLTALLTSLVGTGGISPGGPDSPRQTARQALAWTLRGPDGHWGLDLTNS